MIRLKWMLVLTACSIAMVSPGQVEELRQAQDTRRKYFPQQGMADPLHASKTLFVNPFIGTGGHGHTFPGATAPFGMMQLSPDTRYDGWDGCSGYHYSDSILYGFSHTHLSGTGVSDYGDLLIVPQSGVAKTQPGYKTSDGYGDVFSHDNEEARPGFYSVHLQKGNIDARFTVSERAGIHEYSFNAASGKAYILIDLDHRDRVLDAGFSIRDKQTIEGFRISEAWATEQHFYFHLALSVPCQKAELIEKNGEHKLLLTFPKGTTRVALRVGMSAVDVDGARQNLEQEIPDWNFNRALAAVTAKWEKELNRIQFSSKDPDVMVNFYTALYHSCIAPNIFSDADGRYRGRDMKIHTLDDKDDAQYTVFSLWDTYRATHPMFTLTQVARTSQFIRTFLRQYKEGGDLPVWELAGNETDCMIGFHSASVIADAHSKGIGGFDVQKAVQAMMATSSMEEFGKKYFQKNGYLNAGKEPESVSKALEYAYDSYCVGTMLHDETSPETPYSYYQFNFLNHFDPSAKFMRARRGGLWFAPFDPSEVNFNYTEANSWQYSLYAPHAIGVLRNVLGGADSLENWLDRLFTTSSSLSGRNQADITGLIGQYAHGNEPSHHMAYLYNYTGSPHKTNEYVDRILKEMYANAPDGLSGNEDCGQMSSWYVLSALGLYQIAPGNPYYEIGRPLMDEAVIQFESGKKLYIKVKGNSLEAKYVLQVTLNGMPVYRNYLSHEELIAGGTLEFEMGTEPQMNRDKFSHAPTLSELPEKFVPLPYFEQTNRVFTSSMEVSLNVLFPEKNTIHYTTDGSEPAQTSPVYTGPFTIREPTEIKAIASNGSAYSATISNQFIKSNPGVHLDLKGEYANQYASSGPLALIDGIEGENEFRTGDYQGFWAQDVEAVISFDSPRTIQSVSVGCLSDMKSWVFLPSGVHLYYSPDGIQWTEAGNVQLKMENQLDMPAHKKVIRIDIPGSQSIKSLKVRIENAGKCPDWHLGAGNDTWLFMDEISFH